MKFLFFSKSYKLLSFYFLFFLGYLSYAQALTNPLDSKDYEQQTKWVDSIYKKMTLDEKIGQLFTVVALSDSNSIETKKAKELIQKKYIGGIIFLKGNPLDQVKTTNELQKLSKTPLLVSLDAEWGLSMRLDSTYSFPWNMTIGAVKNNDLIRQMGQQIGKHCRRIGIHINFAPDIDINSNYQNPVIGNRSFGENKHNVADKGIAFFQGLKSENVIACAKHFPGHGDTSTDSHKELPIIKHSKERLERIEFYPFKKVIDSGISSIMVAHLDIPNLDSRGYPSSLSKPIITGLLKKKMGFKGLIFTDALNMKGVSDFDTIKDVSFEAFKAGSDIMLMGANISKTIALIKKSYRSSNSYIVKRLEESVKKILKAKYKANLNHYRPIDTKNLLDDINTLESDLVYEKLASEAITVLKNEDQILPIEKLENENIAYLAFGESSGKTFYKHLNLFTKVTQVDEQLDIQKLLDTLAPYSKIIIGLHRSNKTPWKSYKFNEKEIKKLEAIARKKEVILDIFVTPYALKNVSLSNVKGVIVSYQNSPWFQSKSAQIIFGALSSKGALPVSISETYPFGSGLHTRNLKRLQYGLPESEGIDSSQLEKKIDSVMGYIIKEKITPGAQILVARHGKVIYYKSFGFYTYEKKDSVTNKSLYDLASLTKILATLPQIMKLKDEGVIKLKTKLKKMIPQARFTKKSNIRLVEMLSHYAKLKAWIPFYKETFSDMGFPSDKFYSRSFSPEYGLKVAEDMYVKSKYPQKILKKILKSDLLPKKEYKYSDLTFYLLKTYIESYYKDSLNVLLEKDFLKPLGAYRTLYNPLDRFKKNDIAPSEDDRYFRYQVLQGYVHDMGAALEGGVGGHAGLFSNANGVAIIMQMYLQGGYYGGRQYISSDTINEFNTCTYCNKKVRRGIGFDKKQLDGEEGPACNSASKESFGHSGFTGTLTWADPKNELVYVFLSNRTFPTMKNSRLVTENIRTNVQEIIYNAIISK